MTPEQRKPELSTWRFRLSLQSDMGSEEAREQGAAFRAVRRACGLGPIETGRGWCVAVATIDALEAGRQSFPSPQDFRAALSQLWLWGAERGFRG